MKCLNGGFDGERLNKIAMKWLHLIQTHTWTSGATDKGNSDATNFKAFVKVLHKTINKNSK